MTCKIIIYHDDDDDDDDDVVVVVAVAVVVDVLYRYDTVLPRDLCIPISSPPQYNPFYTSIDSMPEIKPRRKSIPLVSDLVGFTYWR